MLKKISQVKFGKVLSKTEQKSITGSARPIYTRRRCFSNRDCTRPPYTVCSNGFCGR